VAESELLTKLKEQVQREEAEGGQPATLRQLFEFYEADLEARGKSAETIGRAQNEWVFPNPQGRPYDRSYVGRVFRKAARAAGLPDFHFHDLRHPGATMALNSGFTGPIVMALGGWKTERMMRRYTAVTDQTLRAAAEAVSGNETWSRSGTRVEAPV